MNTQYEEYWHQAMGLKHQTYELINDHSHPVAHILQHETGKLVDDIELQRKPQTIDDRIQQIQRQLAHARMQGDAVMNTEHTQTLHQDFDQLRHRIRQSPRR